MPIFKSRRTKSTTSASDALPTRVLRSHTAIYKPKEIRHDVCFSETIQAGSLYFRAYNIGNARLKDLVLELCEEAVVKNQQFALNEISRLLEVMHHPNALDGDKAMAICYNSTSLKQVRDMFSEAQLKTIFVEQYIYHRLEGHVTTPIYQVRVFSAY